MHPILVKIVEANDLPAWLQATAAFVSVLIAIGVVSFQEAKRRDGENARRSEAAEAVTQLAYLVVHSVKERLWATFSSAEHRPKLFEIRGHRATEIVETLRQLPLAGIPPSLIPHLAGVRSNIYAVNARLSDIYKGEEEGKAKRENRRSRMKSSARVFGAALDDYNALLVAAKPLLRRLPPSIDVQKSLNDFITESRSVMSSGLDEID